SRETPGHPPRQPAAAFHPADFGLHRSPRRGLSVKPRPPHRRRKGIKKRYRLGSLDGRKNNDTSAGPGGPAPGHGDDAPDRFMAVIDCRSTVSLWTRRWATLSRCTGISMGRRRRGYSRSRSPMAVTMNHLKLIEKEGLKQTLRTRAGYKYDQADYMIDQAS